MKSLFLSILYFVASTLYILSGYFEPVASPLLLKSIIIPLLIVIFVINIRVQASRFHFFILLGMFFSWAGDVLLQVNDQGRNMFVPGLLSFMLAQVMYLVVFFGVPGNNRFLEKHFYLTFILLIYGVALTGLLWDNLEGMKMPVIIYGLVILSMLAGALNRFYKVGRASYYMVLAGAILFVFSDSMLAINKFAYPFRASGLVVMASYVIAQFLIITGYIAQERKALI